jgi:hypothetical protein
MPIRVDAYIETGVASGVLARAGHLREILETSSTLELERVAWQGLHDPASSPSGPVTIAIDDLLVAVADDDPSIPVHASWHAITLDVGPYRVVGEMPTLPGYDPGRALARPTGEFVLLRDVHLARREDPGPGQSIGDHALINRYGVERVSADIMLGFFFPGAVMEGAEAAPA